jgi:UDP-N-acetylglucosamine--dolichyl-phosphate N-acetylglucosaminephosphotransferase
MFICFGRIGINGLECGQSYIIACTILSFKLYEIAFLAPTAAPTTLIIGDLTSTYSALPVYGGMDESQLFVIVMILPLIGTMLGLLRFNWFPASVFVGDTFCYFAGMTFAVIGIHGHFSKTLLLLFVPQVINFLLSLPQLFKLMPCPRHRLPRVDPRTSTLHVSTFPCDSTEYRWYKVRPDDTECPNSTLICVVLRVLGPMSEPALCCVLLALQACCSVFVFWLRYGYFA